MLENKKQGIYSQLTCHFCKNKGHEMISCQLFYILKILEQNMDKLRYSAGIDFPKNEISPYENNSLNELNENPFYNRPFCSNLNMNRFSQGFHDQRFQNYNNFPQKRLHEL